VCWRWWCHWWYLRWCRQRCRAWCRVWCHRWCRWDAEGYPDGRRRADIPLASRILLVCDAFDAMTTDRPYRKALPVDAASSELSRNTGVLELN